MRNVLAKMRIRPGDEILDLGSGTGRNACLMMDALGRTGRLVGVDISEEMLGQSQRCCRPYPQVDFVEARIERPLGFRQEFDKACLFFVLHGFTHLECELAVEFLEFNLEGMLQSAGFGDLVSHPFFRGYLRLLEAHK